MQKEEKNFRSYYDEAEEESHDYFDINDCYDYEGNFDYDWKMPLWMVSTFPKIGKKMMKVNNNNKISIICEQWIRK